MTTRGLIRKGRSLRAVAVAGAAGGALLFTALPAAAHEGENGNCEPNSTPTLTMVDECEERDWERDKKKDWDKDWDRDKHKDWDKDKKKDWDKDHDRDWDKDRDKHKDHDKDKDRDKHKDKDKEAPAVAPPAAKPQHAPVAKAAPATSSRPIPKAVSAGASTTEEWQVPVGAGLVALGATGAVVALRRRVASED